MQSHDLSSSLNLGNRSQMVRLAWWWAWCLSPVRRGHGLGQLLGFFGTSSWGCLVCVANIVIIDWLKAPNAGKGCTILRHRITYNSYFLKANWSVECRTMLNN